MPEEDLVKSLESQLITLYAEKELLQVELGVSSATEIIALIKSMEAQLVDLYADRENAIVIDGNRITIAGAKKIFVRKRKSAS